MKTLINKIKATSLIAIIAVGLLIGGTQQCKAAYYDNYHSDYVFYWNLYISTHNVAYYWDALAYLYYYYAGYYGDYYGYEYDPYGFKSTAYRASTPYEEYYYNYFATIGDQIARHL